MAPSRFIHFFGPDGAGKSTQVELLVIFLRKRGVRAKKWWVRSPHTLAFLFWKLLIRIGLYRVATNPLGAIHKFPAVDRNRLLRWFWSMIEFIGILPVVALTFLNLRLGYTLVAERYILDSITTIAYFENDTGFLTGPASRILRKFIPRSTSYVFLDTDYETIFRRRAHLFGSESPGKRKTKDYGAVPQSAVEPRDFIDFQRASYRSLARSLNIQAIDTSKTSVEETFEIIVRGLRLS